MIPGFEPTNLSASCDISHTRCFGLLLTAGSTTKFGESTSRIHQELTFHDREIGDRKGASSSHNLDSEQLHTTFSLISKVHQTTMLTSNACRFVLFSLVSLSANAEKEAPVSADYSIPSSSFWRVLIENQDLA
jgi:hypothetical protein